MTNEQNLNGLIHCCLCRNVNCKTNIVLYVIKDIILKFYFCRSMLTEYERKIHLDIHQKKTTKRQRKRPKNALSEQSPCTKDDTEKHDDSIIVKKIKTEDRISEICTIQNDIQCMETCIDNCQHSGAAERPDRQTSDSSSGAAGCETLTSNVAVPTYENTAGMYLTNCISGNVVNIAQSSSVSSIHKVPYSNWDFDATLLPDFFGGKLTFELRLPAPELLPDDIGCNGAQIASRGVRQMSKQQVNSQEHSLKCCSNNWGEYKKGLTQLSPDDTLLLCTHAPSLWKGAVTPLVKPHQATSTGMTNASNHPSFIECFECGIASML